MASGDAGLTLPAMSDILPDPGTPFGARIRQRLTDERVIWLTTVTPGGVPQPNPVWFIWDGGDTLLVYNRHDARRLDRLRGHAPVALHFNTNSHGGDVAVLTGTADVLDAPALLDNTAYCDKYADGMVQISGSAEAFADIYSIPVRVTLTHARGF